MPSNKTQKENKKTLKYRDLIPKTIETKQKNLKNKNKKCDSDVNVACIWVFMDCFCMFHAKL